MKDSYTLGLWRCGQAVLLGGIAAFASAAQASSAIDEGQKIYTQGADGVPACLACHGAQGQGQAAANFPFLAGQGTVYLEEQLQALADGSRQNAIMKPIASGLSAQQRTAVVAYIGTLPRPWNAAELAQKATTYPDTADSGAWLANRGDWEKQIPACTQCHAAGGIGVGEQFPAIAGLSKGYIVEQFSLWRKGQRPAGPLNLMGDIAKRMSDGQTDAVAAYFSTLPQSTPSQAKP
jgi:cytochrome c553